MICYKCGATLAKDDVCPQCGVNVALYKKAVKASNAYYNKGLAKAKVRDLSGAAESLRMSIVINKNNIEARNLLGLVYCEMGDVVEALSQWVISKNHKEDNNQAGTYIKQIQSNQSKFEMVTTTVKKYNLSLRYAQEGSYDMAVIQLKKVIAQNPKLLKAQLLLALLYIREKEYNKARKPLIAVFRVDHNNTMAQSYMKEIDEALQVKKKNRTFVSKKDKKNEEARPLSGNDVIMPRYSYREPSNGAITIINILAGVIIGAALIWFLITPARYKGLTADYNNSIKEYSEKLSADSAEINSLNNQLKRVQEEKEKLESQLSVVGGTDGSNKLLTAVIDAANLYLANDKTGAAEKILAIDVAMLPTDEAKRLYNTLSAETRVTAASDLYNRGMAKYNSKDYEEAADLFSRAYKCDSARAEIAYHAAKSYDAMNNTAEAKKYFQYIVDEFKSSGYFVEANSYVNSH